jgi:hypothetical protein
MFVSGQFPTFLQAEEVAFIILLGDVLGFMLGDGEPSAKPHPSAMASIVISILSFFSHHLPAPS